MNDLVIVNDYYQFEEKIPSLEELWIAEDRTQLDEPLEVEAFINLAMESKIPVEIINIRVDGFVSLPRSFLGKTKINWAGESPLLFVEIDQDNNPLYMVPVNWITEVQNMTAQTDKFGNVLIMIPADCALEVITSTEKTNIWGKRVGATRKKIIYICE